jgi:hypothetical protein
MSEPNKLFVTISLFISYLSTSSPIARAPHSFPFSSRTDRWHPTLIVQITAVIPARVRALGCLEINRVISSLD